MRRSHLRAVHAFEGINVTPLIDVVMCLIIFFLLVGKLAADRSNQIDLPDTRHGESGRAADPMVVDVAKTAEAGAAWLAGMARISVTGHELADAAALEALVRDRVAHHPETTIEIRADEELPFGAIEPALRVCVRAGAKTVRLATEKRS